MLVDALSSSMPLLRRWVFFQRKALTPSLVIPQNPLEPWAPSVVSRPHRRLARQASSNYCDEASSDDRWKSDPIPDEPPSWRDLWMTAGRGWLLPRGPLLTQACYGWPQQKCYCVAVQMSHTNVSQEANAKIQQYVARYIYRLL